MDRRHLVIALAAMPALGPLSAFAAKLSLCKPCNGNGNCTSGVCSDGACMPAGDVCGGPRRTFRCVKGEPSCCRRKHGCHRI